MKPLLIILSLSLALSISGCVAVAVKSTNRDTQHFEKVQRVFIICESNETFVPFYSKLAQHLSADLRQHGIETDSFVMKRNNAQDEKIMLEAQLKAFGAGYILEIHPDKSRISIDEGHIDENALLEATLTWQGADRYIWRSSILVTSGGAVGLGTIGMGTGGKLTAQKISRQLEVDGIIQPLPTVTRNR